MSESYYVIGTTRDARYRTFRAKSPVRQRHMRFICGNQIRLLSGRAQLLREDFLKKYENELRILQRNGSLEVRVGSPTGPRYDFTAPASADAVLETVSKAIADKIVEELHAPSELRKLFVETPVEPVPEPEPVVEPEPAPVAEVVDEPVSEPSPEPIPGDAALSSMGRKELVVVYTSRGGQESDLDGMTKRHILAKLSEMRDAK